MVRLIRAEMQFHADCWAVLHLNVQREYELRAQDEGISALLVPYNRSQVGAWLPSEVDDEGDFEGAGAEHVGLAVVPDVRDEDLPRVAPPGVDPGTEAVAS
jgi:hypothetical protein